VPRRCSAARASAGPAALTLLLAGVGGCTVEPDAEPAAMASSTGAAATVTVTVTAAPDPAPAAPDPAPAAPDPAAPPPMTVAAVRTPSAVGLACAAVEEAVIDAVARYEVQALAEDGVGGGNRTAAWSDMGEAMDRAVREAAAVPGLAAAAAPAMAEVAALRDGMAARTTLDEDDAEPWRDARDRLETWCDGQD
jgi:hypothetical protein